VEKLAALDRLLSW